MSKMKKIISIFLILFTTICFSQNQVLNLLKTAESEFILDGILSEAELKNAFPIEIIYEHFQVIILSHHTKQQDM